MSRQYSSTSPKRSDPVTEDGATPKFNVPWLSRILLPACCMIPLLLQAGNSSPHKTYNLEGVWSDACPCRIPCPCWRNQNANVVRCVNPQVFHITKGHFGGHDLSGVTFVLVGLPNRDYGPPDFYRAYGSMKDIPTADLFATVFQLPLERGTEAISVPQVKLSDSSHFIRIPNLLTYDVGANVYDGPLSPELDGYLYPWLRDAKQWTVRRVEYGSGAERISYAGTNSLTGRFKIKSGEDLAEQDQAQSGSDRPNSDSTNTPTANTHQQHLRSTCRRTGAEEE